MKKFVGEVERLHLELAHSGQSSPARSRTSRIVGAESLRDLGRSPCAGRSVKGREVFETPGNMLGRWAEGGILLALERRDTVSTRGNPEGGSHVTRR